MNDDEALAKRRFLIISLVRLSGGVFLTLGLFILGGKFAMPKAAGWAFTLIGMLDLLVAPVFLSRKWRSPRP
jgi:hypothetical protein